MQEGLGQAAVVLGHEDVAKAVVVPGDSEGVGEGVGGGSGAPGQEAGEAAVRQEVAVAVVEKRTELGHQGGQLPDLPGSIRGFLAGQRVGPRLPAVLHLEKYLHLVALLDVLEGAVEVVQLGVEGLGAAVDGREVAAG